MVVQMMGEWEQGGAFAKCEAGGGGLGQNGKPSLCGLVAECSRQRGVLWGH